MFAIIIIVIIIGKSHARTWSWLQDGASQFYLVPFSNPSWGKYSVMQGLSSRFMSKFSWHSFGIFHPTIGSPLPSAKLSDDHHLGEALETWPKKYNWCKKVISPEKHPLNRIYWSNCSPFLNSVLQFFFFLKMHQSSNWNMYISSNNNIFFIFIFIVSDLVFIYFWDSTYNFRLCYLVLDYITENLKLGFN